LRAIGINSPRPAESTVVIFPKNCNVVMLNHVIFTKRIQRLTSANVAQLNKLLGPAANETGYSLRDHEPCRPDCA
jgi:hypothetical protein